MSRILIAEDDPHILRVISLWLSRQGHEVVEARNGLVALELFGSCNPEILVTDVNMPGMDGIELLDKIDEQEHDLAGIVVLTNRWDHRELHDRIAAGRENVHVVPKPFSPNALANLIEDLVAARASS